MSLLSITQAKGRALVELTLLVIDLGFRGLITEKPPFLQGFFVFFLSLRLIPRRFLQERRQKTAVN
jgi:hypothetical protein